MKAKENKKKLVRSPKSALLPLVAAKLKNRVLFPKKIEEVKEYLKNAEIKIA